MARKKKAPDGPNEAAWVTEPEAAPEDAPFCDVTYEQRCHKADIEVLGVTFVPGQIVTFRTRADVPDEFLAHPDLDVHDTMFGVCRIDPMHRYTRLTAPALEVLAARGTIPRFDDEAVVADEVVADSDQPEGDE